MRCGRDIAGTLHAMGSARRVGSGRWPRYPQWLFYVGRSLPFDSGAVEPALINPDLPIAASPGRYDVPLGCPELAYHLLSPVIRKAYLDCWLVAGAGTSLWG
jgi:hypothetical protein